MFELSENDIPASTFEGQAEDTINSSTPELQTSPEPQYFEYQASGKTVKEDLETILKRASQGYNYAQLVNEHKGMVDSFSKERDQHLAQLGVWKQYDEYANQNPQWAEFVKSQWESRQSYGQPQSEFGHQQQQGSDIHPEVRAFMDEYRSNQRVAQEQAEDAALHEQIQSVQKDFPDFDLSYSDPSTGQSLELQIIEHAKAHGINSFKAAFKDYMFDKIIEKRITSAKEATAKELANRTKQGFISKSDTSLNDIGSKGFKSSGSLHDDLIQGAMELGIQL
jgi:hypothetical protein